MYAVKVYTIDGLLIYQVESGGSNIGNTPKGGVVNQSSPAESMMATIANPITFYGGYSAVINQAGHSKDLYNYYWISYSRGTDGQGGDAYVINPLWHNVYLDGYIPLRAKSIYDPCPYLYRIPSNGTFNQFTYNSGWTNWSYLAGTSWNMINLGESWFIGSGYRHAVSNNFNYIGSYVYYRFSTPRDQSEAYILELNYSKFISVNRKDETRSYGHPVRCIEEVECRPEQIIDTLVNHPNSLLKHLLSFGFISLKVHKKLYCGYVIPNFSYCQYYIYL